MIINDVKKNVLSEGQFATSTFRIAASAKAFQILSSNIYTHKVRAVIREICCNAHDAHVAAGNSEPFDVHLPTVLEPWFTVRDFGTGLSEEDIRDIFTTYFSSTKSHSNDFTGALGLGSKSPFCLVDSFIVTSYYGGEKKIYNCYKDASGEPTIALMTSEASSEPNGLEVAVPGLYAKRHEFHTEAVEVFQYFDSIPNINIKDVVREIEESKNKYLLTGPDFAFSQSFGSPKAVMGNVAYDIPYELRDSLGFAGFLRFPIGELSFDPGRENLSLDDATILAIKTKITEVKEKLAAYALQEIESLPTIFQRRLKCQKFMVGPLGSLLNSSVGDWKKKLREYQMPSLTSTAKVIGCSRKRAFVEYRAILDFTESRLVICLDKPRMDRRLKHYAKESGSIIYVLTPDQVQELSLDVDRLTDIDSIPKIPYRRTVKQNGKSTVKVEKWNRSFDYLEEATVVPAGEKVFFTISRKTILTKLWRLNDQNRLNYTLDKLVDLINVPELFVLREANMKSKRFLKEQSQGEWIDLESYLLRELRALFGSSIQSYEGDSDFADVAKNIVQGADAWMPLDSAFDDFRKFHTGVQNCQKNSFAKTIYCDLLSAFRDTMEMENDESLSELEKNLLDRFPMLRLVNSNLVTGGDTKFVLDYIKNN